MNDDIAYQGEGTWELNLQILAHILKQVLPALGAWLAFWAQCYCVRF